MGPVVQESARALLEKFGPTSARLDVMMILDKDMTIAVLRGSLLSLR